MERRAREFAGLLGLVLGLAWVVGWYRGASSWLVWTDLLVAIVVLAGLGPAMLQESPGIATWPFAGLLLFAAWLFGLSFGATPWLTWLNLGVSCAFLLLTIGFTLASSHVTLFHRHRLGHS